MYTDPYNSIHEANLLVSRQRALNTLHESKPKRFRLNFFSKSNSIHDERAELAYAAAITAAYQK